jgi:hypothetical protein
MNNWWRKFKAWDEQRRRKYLLERWEHIRAKGKTYFVVRVSLVRSLILSTCMGVGRWYGEFGFSPRALVSSDLLFYWGFILIFVFLAYLLSAEREWNSTEKNYQQLKEQQNLRANKI